MIDYYRPQWAEEAVGDAYELAVVFEHPDTPWSKGVAEAVAAAFARLQRNNPTKSFGPARFEHMPWGLYAQVLAVEGAGLTLLTPPAFAAAAFAWFSQRKAKVSDLEGGRHGSV